MNWSPNKEALKFSLSAAKEMYREQLGEYVYLSNV